MKKVFDCVEMKREIQRRHQREVEQLGKEEADKRRWQRILDDPVLGAFVRTHPLGGRGEARESRKEVVG